MRLHSFAVLSLAACAGDPTQVRVELSPSVISSLDGTTTVAALIADDDQPLADVSARITVAYTDRNGTPHDIAPQDVRSDDRGIATARLEGLIFDGTGIVTVDAGTAIGTAQLAVLDRTPPHVEILPPTADLHVGPGLPISVQVRITDEIGVAEVFLDGEPTINARSTVVTSGALDTTVTFRDAIPADATPGPTIQLNALARDVAGNFAAAAVVTLTVDPAITVATPPDLVGSLLVDGSAQQLVDPRALVVSAKDGKLYVADRAQTGPCNPSCIWRVDATTGAIDATPVVVGQGVIEGVAVDATSDNLFFTDRANRTGRLTFDGAAYTGAVACSDPQQQRPQTPFHVVADATLGLLVPDDNSQELVRVASCAAGSVGADFSTDANLEAPRGIALGPAGEIYVSDQDRDRILRIDRTSGAATSFAAGISSPYGLEWLAGASVYADSLLVASTERRVVTATRGAAAETDVVFLRNSPIDVALAGGTLYVLTSPGFGNRGRIYKVTGF